MRGKGGNAPSPAPHAPSLSSTAPPSAVHPPLRETRVRGSRPGGCEAARGAGIAIVARPGRSAARGRCAGVGRAGRLGSEGGGASCPAQEERLQGHGQGCARGSR